METHLHFHNVGAKGKKGPTGPPGKTGPKGLTGFRGATGAQGATGVQGVIGDKGPTGVETTGVQGPAGVGQLGLTGLGVVNSFTYITTDTGDVTIPPNANYVRITNMAGGGAGADGETGVAGGGGGAGGIVKYKTALSNYTISCVINSTLNNFVSSSVVQLLNTENQDVFNLYAFYGVASNGGAGLGFEGCELIIGQNGFPGGADGTSNGGGIYGGLADGINGGGGMGGGPNGGAGGNYVDAAAGLGYPGGYGSGGGGGVNNTGGAGGPPLITFEWLY